MPKGEKQTVKAMARVGERHGMLVIKAFCGSNKYRRAIFECVCDCGNVAIKTSIDLDEKAHC